jgi:hypothetical protein
MEQRVEIDRHRIAPGIGGRRRAKGALGAMPALLTRMSIGPCARAAANGGGDRGAVGDIGRGRDAGRAAAAGGSSGSGRRPTRSPALRPRQPARSRADAGAAAGDHGMMPVISSSTAAAPARLRASGCGPAGSCRSGTGRHLDRRDSRAGRRRRSVHIGSIRCGRASATRSARPAARIEFDMVGLEDVADRHRRDARLVADLVRERGLEHAAIDGLGLGPGLARGDVDQVGAPQR